MGTWLLLSGSQTHLFMALGANWFQGFYVSSSIRMSVGA